MLVGDDQQPTSLFDEVTDLSSVEVSFLQPNVFECFITIDALICARYGSNMPVVALSHTQTGLCSRGNDLADSDCLPFLLALGTPIDLLRRDESPSKRVRGGISILQPFKQVGEELLSLFQAPL